ncbi:GAF domain-containing protein [Rhizorhabdus dicambivorans]|nr:GAF domain-containing protein [Rhizorhabdus dicambivorans]
MIDDLQADIAAIQRIGCMSSMLELCCQVTGMGYAAVSRVTESSWIACAVRDEAGFGIAMGDELDVDTTICGEVRTGPRAILIDHVAEDPIFREHRTPRLYGFQSYISSPILRADGRLFGSLFAVDTAPAKLANSNAPNSFNLFARLIAMELDAADAG